MTFVGFYLQRVKKVSAESLVKLKLQSVLDTQRRDKIVCACLSDISGLDVCLPQKSVC